MIAIDINMPKYCTECPVCKCSNIHTQYCQLLHRDVTEFQYDKFGPDENRPNDCPLEDISGLSDDLKEVNCKLQEVIRMQKASGNN